MRRVQILQNDEIRQGSFADLGQKHLTVWADVTDPTPEEVELVSSHVHISEPEFQSLLEPQRRPVLQDVGRFTAVVFHAPELKEVKVILRPHLLLASKEQQDFVTLHLGDSEALEKINAYPAKRKIGIFERGATALLFAALSEMVEGGFQVLDYVSEQISKLEEQILEPKMSEQVMKKIFNLKKNLIYFQRALAADREVVSEIEKAYGRFLDSRQFADFRLLYADLTQLIELSTTYRDIIISAVEVHLAAISNNLNVVMKRLTAWAAIILVPSLIAGIYGMNFAFLPFAHHPTGFWYVLGAMVISVWALYSYFKFHDWI